MAKMARDIAYDRDAGITYSRRQKQNNAKAGDMPDLNKWLHGMTKLIYVDLKTLSPNDIAVAQAEACVNGG